MQVKKKFKIVGMHCTSCVMNIDGEIEDTGKISKVCTSYAKAETDVEFDPSLISDNDIIKVIKKAGYEATLIRE